MFLQNGEVKMNKTILTICLACMVGVEILANAQADFLVPSKFICTATSNIPTGRFFGKNLSVEIDNSPETFSVFIKANGKPTPFIQDDIFCGNEYKADDVDRNCTDKLDGSSVSFSRERECLDLIPGTNRITTAFRTGFSVNSVDGKSVNGATGEVTCVVGADGFSSLKLSQCLKGNSFISFKSTVDPGARLR
jgi:hypothetical protein